MIKDFFKFKIKRPIKHTYQKLIRGFSDDVTWSFDFQIAKWILPRLKRFKKIHRAYPGPQLTEEQWDMELDKMLSAFSLIVDENLYYLSNEESEKVIQEGLDSFRKYFQALWW